MTQTSKALGTLRYRCRERAEEKEGHLKYLSTPEVVVPNFEDVDEQNFGPFMINTPGCQKL
jgi:hypothetical protein